MFLDVSVISDLISSRFATHGTVLLRYTELRTPGINWASVMEPEVQRDHGEHGNFIANGRD